MLMVTMFLNKFEIFPTACIVLILCNVIKDSSAEQLGETASGDDATIEEFPLMVSLKYSKKYLKCDGTLITPRHVLTAAHCISGPQVECIAVCMGSTSSTCSENPLEVAKTTVHENYRRFRSPSSKYPVNDIGILTLKNPVRMRPTANFVTLPFKNTKLGEIGRLAGWGSTGWDDNNTSLHKAQMKISDCVSPIETGEVPNTLMFGFNATQVGIAVFNSGAPLIVNNEIVGILSWGSRSINEGYNAFTRVFSYKEWIKQNVRSL